MQTKFKQEHDKGREACPQASAVGTLLANVFIGLRKAAPKEGGLFCARKFQNPVSRLSLPLICLCFLPLAADAVRVIEAGAIPFTAFLSKADFDQRYPGKEVSDLSGIEPGWYVIYEHESLSYYFGPVLLESTGKDYLEHLTETVERATKQRPSIQDYRLELSYEPSQSSTPSGSSDGSTVSKDSSSGSGSPPSAPQPSIWDFFKRIFGF